MKKYDLDFDECPECKTPLIKMDLDSDEEIVEIGCCPKCDVCYDNEGCWF